MVRWCRIIVLVLVGFYAVTGGIVSSPLAAIGTGCSGAASDTDDHTQRGCDTACPPSLCIVAPYVAPVPSPAMATLTIQPVRYAVVKAKHLPSNAPNPALRPPNT